MTVNIEEYRIRIGINCVNGRNNQRKFKTPVTKPTSLHLVIFLLLMFIKINPHINDPIVDNTVRNSQNDSKEFKLVLWAMKDPTMNFNINPTWGSLNWSFSVASNNSLNHSLLGNRQRLGYKLAFWNCRKGLIDNLTHDTDKAVDIRRFIDKHKPHIFGIIETNLHSINSRVHRRTPVTKEVIEEKLNIEGYNIELPDTWDHYGQARVLAYVSKDLQYTRRSDPSVNDLPNVTLEIGLGRERKSLVNIFYREWTGGVTGDNDPVSQTGRWARQIHYWSSLYNQNKDVLILGDANLCAYKWNDTDYEGSKKVLANMIQEMLLEHSSYQLVEGFTRSELTNGTVTQSTIDHVYTNVPNKCTKPQIEAAGDSDHLAIIFTKYSKELRNKAQTVMKRSYKNFDAGLFLQDIFNSELNKKVTETDNIDDAARLFQEIFTQVLDKHAPVKMFQTRKNYVPYLSEDMKRLLKERDVLKEEATKTGDKVLFEEYKKKRNLIKGNLAKEKLKHYTQGLYDEKITTKKAWKLVNSMLGKVDNKSPTKIQFENKIISNPKGLANAFNKIFQTKVKKLRDITNNDTIKVDPKVRLESWLGEKVIPKFELKEIDLIKLRKIMKKVKPSRSHGVDFIDSNSLKLAFPIIEDSILHLINLSISSNKFSDIWKTQLVLPLHKKDDPMDGTNYRPVAHIIELGKIIEYVVHDQVYDHFKSNQLFHAHHHGFLGNHSTASALIQIHDSLLEAAENRELSAALLLDLSAAFDIVDHPILMKKLQAYNFSEDSIEWFRSYLGSRTQTVQVESKFSNPEPLGEYGVPQGSVLGPLIFIIFNNDFAASGEEGTSVVYADDDTDLIHDSDPRELNEKIQREADRSTDWVADNRMVCAGAKTKLLVIATDQMRRSRLRDLKLKVDVCDATIEETKSEKLLGLTVNNNLTWKEYLYGESWRSNGNARGLLSQLAQRAGILSKIVKTMPSYRFKQICSGIFYSKLIYCIQIFGNVWNIPNCDETKRRSRAFSQEDNRKLQVLQNKILRLKTGLPYDSTTASLLAASGDLSIQQLTAYTSLLTAQKSIIHQEPVYLTRKLQRSQDSLKVTSPKYSLSVSRDSFFYRTAALYNLLPVCLRNETNPEQFKKLVKPWILANIPIKPGEGQVFY